MKAKKEGQPNGLPLSLRLYAVFISPDVIHSIIPETGVERPLRVYAAASTIPA